MLKLVAAPSDSAPTRPTLRRNLTWTLTGQVSFMASRFLLAVLIARILDKEAVGVYTLAVSICAPLFEFAKLNLRAVQATDARDEIRFGTCIALRIATTAGVLAVVAGSCWLQELSWPKTAATLGLALVSTVDMLVDVVAGMLFKQEIMWRVGASQMIHAVLRPAALCVGMLVAGALAPAMFLMVVVSCLIAATFDLKSLRIVTKLTGESAAPDWNGHRLWRLFAAAGPLGVNALLDQSVMHAPRLVIEEFVSTEALGTYGACSLFMIAGAVPIIAASDALRPRMAKYFLDDRRRFAMTLGAFFAFTAAVGAAGMAASAWFGSFLLRIVFGPEFAGDEGLLFWMSCAGAVWYLSMTAHTAVLMTRRFVAQLPVSAASAAASLCCAWAWTPQFGVKGAAWACAAGFAVRMAGAVALLCWIVFREAPRDGE